MADRIWITWETQRRNRTMSRQLGAQLHEIDLDLPAWRRYPLAISKTLSIFAREKPRIIFAQNPSLVLACLAVLYARLTGKKIVVDAHNAGLLPAEGKYPLLNWVASRLFRWTDITIVSNPALAKHVEQQHGRAVAIPDPVPEFGVCKPKSVQGNFNVLFVCSWAEDEPYLEVLRAAAQLDKDICIYITGNSRGKHLQAGDAIPGNVHLTGFIAEPDFNTLMCSCDAVLVLTTRENCLVCGAYEGVAAGKPLILSNTQALRNHFRLGSIYVDNNADSIAGGIQSCRERLQEAGSEIAELKTLLRSEYTALLEQFEQQLDAV